MSKNNVTIIMLQGVPASGKSTYAMELALDNDDYVIVSRDSIRESLGDYWVPSREGLVDDIEMNSVVSAIDCGYSPIIDATNLNPLTISKWENLAAEKGVELVRKLFKVDYFDAVERDSKRKRPVGEKVIRKFFMKYFPEDFPGFHDDRIMKEFEVGKKNCIICDLDGTLALNKSGRSWYDYKNVKNDTIDFRLFEVLKSISKDMDVIFLTGRVGDSVCENVTREWLSANIGDSFEWKLYMRTTKDSRKDFEVKRVIYQNIISKEYNVVAVFEDRDNVVEMWRNEGLLCLQVYNNKL